MSPNDDIIIVVLNLQVCERWSREIMMIMIIIFLVSSQKQHRAYDPVGFFQCNFQIDD